MRENTYGRGTVSLAFVGPTLLGVGLLTAVSVAILLLARTPKPLAPLTAIARGVLQLAAISLILTGIIRQPLLVAAALLVMFSVASWTAAGRLGGRRQRLPLAVASMGTGGLVSGAIVFLSGAIALDARYALAVGGIIIGNTMTSATLAGRRFVEAVDDRWDEVEGWLALGARPREATIHLARRSLYAALIPSIDQTRTTGLVTLPGAFVGAIFGGVSPVEAGRFQIVVLAGILAAGTITAAVVIGATAAVRTRPANPV